MSSKKTVITALVVAVLLVPTFFLAPIIGYTESLALPFAYTPGSFQVCSSEGRRMFAVGE